jgi:lysine/arginine/ornithine transport system substrate-binding protein
MNLCKVYLAIACVLGATAVHAESAQVLRFGLEAQYAPFESRSASGALQGFDIDVGNAVCKEAKLKCQWVETSFDGLIPALQARKFDAINSAMHVNAKRLQVIDFTTVIYRTPSQLVARTGSGLLPTSDSLKGKRVGVLQGSIHEAYAKAHWEPAGVTVVSYPDQAQVYADLQAGRLDATLVEALAAQTGFLSKPEGKGFGFAGGLVSDETIMGSGGVAFGVRKGDRELKDRLDTAIAKLKTDGTIKSLGEKYFGGVDISAK